MAAVDFTEQPPEVIRMLHFDCRFAYDTGFRLDFAFDAGQGVTALVGPSGSGKTTVLNLIAGILRPTSGSIRLHDRILYDAASRVNLPPERREVGYVFQDYQLFPHLSVAENLRYGQRRVKSGAISYDKIVEILDLGEVVERAPYSLSGGQKQRVALGRALLRCPRLLLLDEPLSALDMELRASIAQYLARSIEEFKLPALLVTHDPHSVAALAHATIVMQNQAVRAVNM
jgi:molybdate transport system ATP-binding protein